MIHAGPGSEAPIHIHLIGVCGTAMGSLAGLLRHQGHQVTGSDTAFYPPMGDALKRWGIQTRTGFDAAHLSPAPDLVVVGNVCRRDNPEARAAIDAGLPYLSLPGALQRFFLSERRCFVVAGTHGKTTTTALLAYLLDRSGGAPGFLIGGIVGDFEQSFRAGTPGGDFVIEGDEYDSAFFEKSPKFWQYSPQVACVHAVEHDHIDIYPQMASYRAAFERFCELLPESGLLALNAADPEVRALAPRARCRVRHFALEGRDTGGLQPDWSVSLEPRGESTLLTLTRSGGAPLELSSPLSGEHNAMNVAAAVIMAHEGAGVPLAKLAAALPSFRGIRRRQELRGEAAGVRVYDDFAHHPSAVRLTLEAMRQRHPQGRLVAVFEPRSATASRNLHQDSYAEAFAAADLTWLAPVGRPEIDAGERLDVEAIAAAIRTRGGQASAAASIDAIVEALAAQAREGDTLVVMSNGAFGGIHERLLSALAAD